MAAYVQVLNPNVAMNWRSLNDIQRGLETATFTDEAERCFRIGAENVPVSQVAQAIYELRPWLPGSEEDDAKLQAYFQVAKRFNALLPPKEGEPTTWQKVSNCFWGFYCLCPMYWCTSTCQEKVIVADAQFDMKGIRDWREHLEVAAVS